MLKFDAVALETDDYSAVFENKCVNLRFAREEQKCP